MGDEQKVTFEKKESFQTKERSGAGGDLSDFGRQESFPPAWARLDDRGFGSDLSNMHRRFNDLSSNWGDVYRHRQIRENPRDFERLVDDMWHRMRLDPGPAPPSDFIHSYLGRAPKASMGAPVRESAPVIPPPPRDFGIDRQVSEVKNEKEAWTVKLDCSQYTPEEIEVKCRDNQLFVIGKHDEREDNTDSSYVSRQFSRRYVLPDDVDPSRVSSSLSRDGMLTVEASKLAIEGPKERKIPIEIKPVGAIA